MALVDQKGEEKPKGNNWSLILELERWLEWKERKKELWIGNE